MDLNTINGLNDELDRSTEKLKAITNEVKRINNELIIKIAKYKPLCSCCHLCQQPEMTPLSKLKQAFIGFLSSFCCYGLANILRTERLLIKIMWIVFMAISTGLCFLFLYFSCQSYAEWNVVTESRLIYNMSLIFPQIVVCKDNHKEDMEYRIKSCVFNRIDCTKDFDIIEVFDDYGNKKQCIRFNGGKNNTMPVKYQTGERSIFNGLIMKLTHPDTDLNLVYINKQGESPPLYQADLLVKNKQMSSIDLSMFIEKKMEYPYNECNVEAHFTSGDLMKLTKKFNQNYDYQKCLYLCYFYKTGVQNNCSYPGIFDQMGTKNCSEILDVPAETARFNYSVCQRECPIACDTQYFNMIANFDDDHYAGTDFKLYVYYSALRYTEIRQIAKYTFTDLVSSIGGTLGLFMGLRMLNIVDMLEFCLEVMFLAGTKIRSKSTSNPGS